ncbi:MAG: 1-acyl-sn-glycerol-3-phosphate acyltransferase [Cyanobacteriota bacterium]|nr:1-acyl-sn-glycerol-3-phosphate acyltransferase [Cyanobacteriota bacterium]
MPAEPPLEFLPPRLNGAALAVSRALLPLWLRQQSQITHLEVRYPERLVEAMAQFQAGENRLLLAFRHPSVDDPACMAHLLWRALPQEAKRLGVRFRPAPHAQFLYDRGIPLWAGQGVGWLLSRLGGCSIQRGKLDAPALRTARQLLLNGPHPFAVAPEGATNGHNEVVSPLEPGVAQLAFWTAEDLAKAGRLERMVVLPIGLQYGFSRPVWPAIEGLLSQLEREAGLPSDPTHSLEEEALYRRLFALAERLLTLMEGFYRDAYHRPLPEPSPLPPGVEGQRALGERLQRLLETALEVVESSFGLQARGDLASRCRRLEQAGWERIHPANGVGRRSTLERGLADRLAEETERRLWHMRLVETFVAVSGTYVSEQPSQERFADTLLLLWDTQCRLLGGTPRDRPRLGPRHAWISIDRPIPIDERLEAYRADRRRAVASLTGELQRRLEGLIFPTGPSDGGGGIQAGPPSPSAADSRSM